MIAKIVFGALAAIYGFLGGFSFRIFIQKRYIEHLLLAVILLTLAVAAGYLCGSWEVIP